MRVQFKQSKQRELILKYKRDHLLTWQEFADFLHVKKSTVLTWCHEKNLLPYGIYLKLDKQRLFNRQILNLKKEYWGQSKGGIASTGTTKEISLPRHCADLAELIGIILGDGNLHEYIKTQKIRTYMLRIAGDSKKDKDYLMTYVAPLCECLFSIQPKFLYQKQSNELFVILHSKKVIEFFKKMGLTPGDKIKNRLNIPGWVLKDETYLRACLRGLIDTDGSIFRMSNRDPQLLRINFRNVNSSLLETVYNSFVTLGFKPAFANNVVYLSRKQDIVNFLKGIGFSNSKHRLRLKKFKDSPVV